MNKEQKKVESIGRQVQPPLPDQMIVNFIILSSLFVRSSVLNFIIHSLPLPLLKTGIIS